MKLHHEPMLVQGRMVAALGIHVSGRRVLSCPTQIGCVVGCSFCVSGAMRSAAGLGAGEMAAMCRRALAGVGGAGPVDLSLCGEGEPLMNWRACEELRSRFEELVGEPLASARYCMSGIGSKLLARLRAPEPGGPRLRLQWSAHSPFDAKRRELMRRTEDIGSIVSSIVESEGKFDEVAINYVLVEGFNDSEADIEALAKLGPSHWPILLSPLLESGRAKPHPRAARIEGELAASGRSVRRYEAVAKRICESGIYDRLASDAILALG